MAVELEINGVMRQYELFIPSGAAEWADKTFAQSGRNGLPLIVMLHGYGNKPAQLKFDWNFGSIIENSSVWDDKAFVLIPYGLSEENNSQATGAEPMRSWAAWPNLAPQHVVDETAIDAMITHASGLVQNYFTDRGVTRASFDVDRMHLFGYSNGALMAFRLANSFPDKFASIYAICGTDGGRTYKSGALQINKPKSSGTKKISLTLYVGGNDRLIPPGTVGQVGVELPSTDPKAWLVAHGLNPTEADENVVWLRTAYDTIKDFVDYNKGLIPTFNNNLGVPSVSWPNQVDVNGTLTRTSRVWRNGLVVNPAVNLIWDNVMGHTDATGAGRYISAAIVFDIFKVHPRV